MHDCHKINNAESSDKQINKLKNRMNRNKSKQINTRGYK